MSRGKKYIKHAEKVILRDIRIAHIPQLSQQNTNILFCIKISPILYIVFNPPYNPTLPRKKGGGGNYFPHLKNSRNYYTRFYFWTFTNKKTNGNCWISFSNPNQSMYMRIKRIQQMKNTPRVKITKKLKCIVIYDQKLLQ